MVLSNKKPLPVTGPRVCASLVVGFVVIVLSTTLFSWWSMGEVKIQPMLTVVVWCGFNLPLLPGGLMVMLLGYVADSLSGGVVGLQVIANVAVFCACAIAQRQLALNNWFYQMAAVAIMSFASTLIIIGGLTLTSRQHLMPDELLSTLVWQAIISALLAPFFFMLLEGAVRLLQKIWPASGHGKVEGL